MKRSCFNVEDDHLALEGYFKRDSGNKEPASIETFLHNYTSGRPKRFSYKQLKKYTNNFSYKIGQGGFGSVFKGQLPNSFTIAVKVLDVATEKSEAQFLNDVLTIGRIHHNHLVRILGYCFEQSRRALIW
ncbi:Receptor-like kinase [Thalictrum thalictroides]|uniref:Receptor-like kinase n=1 Tax=Thalictrum thalictroides TaxID=46969 RepID=A0A7J6XBL4_THATH|nr:Receptor-like kinase [Thalictrum thalictroides]